MYLSYNILEIIYHTNVDNIFSRQRNINFLMFVCLSVYHFHTCISFAIISINVVICNALVIVYCKFN